ncbi:MAG: imidazoleglycerol-phosphate dehydratase HisB, partial [Asticcacaulis sp.]|nr:imidazoleglycerol-phosphate dehydratase HisB [Asticcacaulis sp.]
LEGFDLNDGPFMLLRPANLLKTQTALKKVGLSAQNTPNGLLLALGDAATNNRILKALDVPTTEKAPRVGEILRDTKETRISVLVNLDDPKPVKVNTGIGFFDHMLDQVATHGGFSLQLACEGDLHIDGHHTVEDCMLALGQAMKIALGDRVGMARFGFVVPMDETEAKVSIDLGGRPFCVFKGAFETTHIGDYQTEMTAHAFRSLSETLGASIHVEVEGGNDHHKTEACFKALGRALRQATRIEGDALPSTKGMLA